MYDILIWRNLKQNGCISRLQSKKNIIFTKFVQIMPLGTIAKLEINTHLNNIKTSGSI